MIKKYLLKLFEQHLKKEVDERVYKIINDTFKNELGNDIFECIINMFSYRGINDFQTIGSSYLWSHDKKHYIKRREDLIERFSRVCKDASNKNYSNVYNYASDMKLETLSEVDKKIISKEFMQELISEINKYQIEGK